MRTKDQVKTRTVPEILRGIAHDIKTRGHFQTGRDHDIWNPKTGKGKCCVLRGPSLWSGRDPDGDGGPADDEISAVDYIKAKIEEEWRQAHPDENGYSWPGVVGWSDTTPTSEVLAKLNQWADEYDTWQEKAHADYR